MDFAAQRTKQFNIEPPSEGADSAEIVGFRMERQAKDFWCWAAVALSVKKHYDASCMASQCDVVNIGLSRDDCCEGDNCNDIGYLDRILPQIGFDCVLVKGQLREGFLTSEIRENKPVMLRIGWPSKEGHFVVAIGYKIVDGKISLKIADPRLSGSQNDSVTFRPLDAVSSDYDGGSWTHSFLARPARS